MVVAASVAAVIVVLVITALLADPLGHGTVDGATTTSSTSTSAAPTTVGAPIIDAFTATAEGPPCDSTHRRLILSWSSTHAAAATITGPDAPVGTLPASGTTASCAPLSAATYLLTVTGPGGSPASRTITA